MAEKIIPGIYQTDTSNVNKLEEEYEQEIEKSQLEAKKWAKHKTEYTHLKEKLSTITDKTTHNVMVPFGGKKAFFEGMFEFLFREMHSYGVFTSKFVKNGQNQKNLKSKI